MSGTENEQYAQQFRKIRFFRTARYIPLPVFLLSCLSFLVLPDPFWPIGRKVVAGILIGGFVFSIVMDMILEMFKCPRCLKQFYDSETPNPSTQCVNCGLGLYQEQ